MPDRQGLRWGWVGVVGAAALASGGVYYWTTHRAPSPAAPALPSVARESALDENSSLDRLAAGIERGEGLPLAVVQKRLVANDPAPAVAIPDEESQGWQAVLEGIRKGQSKYSAYGRASALTIAGRVVDRYHVEPTPADWPAGLVPFAEIVAAGLADSDPGVRATAVNLLGGVWKWAPGRDMTLGQVDHVAAWKEGLHRLAVQALGDPEPRVRATAVAALAAIPLDDQAAPAAALMTDASPEVRFQVLAGFAQRRELLNEEAILPSLFDATPGMAAAAEKILKDRGLTESQLGMARLIVHPMEAMRLSAIPMVLERTDIDPTIWLIFLSRDSSESVRSKALEALATSDRPEARARISEMATDDPSEGIRQAATRVAPHEVETTAALPPLPGSPALNPKAN